MITIPHVRWSYSAYSSFDKCPRQYNETRVLKNFKVDSPQIRTGLTLHKLFEDRIRDNKPLPPEWAHYENSIQGFMALPGKKFAEHQLKLNTSGYPTTEKYDYWVQVIMDLFIYQPDNKRAFIVDFKTGKSAYADTQQLKLGALIVFAHYPDVEQIESALWFIKENRIIETTFQREHTLSYWEQFMPGYVKLRNAHHHKVFNPKPSGLCKVCPVTTCNHYRGA